MRKILKPGVLVALLMVLAACAAGPSTGGQLSEGRATRIVEAMLTGIADIYYKETQASDLVAAGLANIDKEFGDIAFEREGTSFIAIVGGERAYAFQPGAYGWTASDWAPEVAAMLEHIETLRSGSDSPDLSVLVDTFIEGITENLDGRTHYASRQDAKAHRSHRVGPIGTVGINVGRVQSRREVKAITDVDLLRSQSLRRDDVILEIDETPLAGLTDREVQTLLHGEIGSPVVLTIERAGTTAPFSVTLLRREAGSNAVSSFPVGKSTHIIMTRFTSNAVADLRTVLTTNQRSDAEENSGLILDLRGNPGGLLMSTVETAQLFLSGAPILSTHGRHADSHQVFNAERRALAEVPSLVILLDENSAAGSEILAAALQDGGRAIVVGTTTFGAGTIQTVLPMPNYGELILTWTEAFTPGNYRLDKRGVMPTVCTGGAATAEDVLAALRSGGGVIDRATRIQDIDPDDTAAIEAFRSLCPPRVDGINIDLEVAQTLLMDLALFAAVLQSSGSQSADARRSLSPPSRP